MRCRLSQRHASWRCAGGDDTTAALAVRSVVFYAGGFILLEHSLQEQPSRLATLPELDEVFEFSLKALVRAIIPS